MRFPTRIQSWGLAVGHFTHNIEHAHTHTHTFSHTRMRARAHPNPQLQKLVFSATLSHNPEKLAALQLFRPRLLAASTHARYVVPANLKVCVFVRACVCGWVSA